MKTVKVDQVTVRESVEAIIDALLLLESNGYTEGGDIVDALVCSLVKLAAAGGIDLSEYDLPSYDWRKFI